MKNGLGNFSDLIGWACYSAGLVLGLAPLAFASTPADAQTQPASSPKSSVQASVATPAQAQRSVASLEQEILMLRERVAILEQGARVASRPPLIVDLRDRETKYAWIAMARNRSQDALDEGVDRWCKYIGYQRGEFMLADYTAQQTIFICFDPPPEQKNQ